MIFLQDKNRILKSSDTHERKTEQKRNKNGIIKKLGKENERERKTLLIKSEIQRKN